MIIDPVDKAHCIPVFLGCDEKYLPHVATTVASLMDSAARERFYDIVVLTTRVNDESVDKLANWFRRFPNGSLRFLNFDGKLEELGAELFHVTDHYPVATYLRFFAPSIFRKYSRIIYLDSDIIVRSDLGELFESDLGGNLLGACHEISREQILDTPNSPYPEDFEAEAGFEKGDSYFNSGVLLLDLERMREENVTEQCAAAMERRPNPPFRDQDILNVVCRNRVRYLGGEWNVYEWCADHGERNMVFHFLDRQTRERCREIRRNARILHFNGKKPWNPDYTGNLGKHYWRYAVQTPFYEQTRKQASECYRLDYAAKMIWSTGFHMTRSGIMYAFGPPAKRWKNERRFYHYRIVLRNFLRKFIRR